MSSKSFFGELFSGDSAINKLIGARNLFNVQVIYTQIDRNAANKPTFTTFSLNDSAAYFYPASTVKLPVALMALQRLGELGKTGINRETTMITEAAYAGQTAVYNDPTTPDGRPTIAQYIRKIFLVSDNDAFNRLYEFLGQTYINQTLSKKGYDHAQILHRLQIALSEDENRHTNPVTFYDTAGKIIYKAATQFNQQPYLQRKDFLGNAYYSKGKLIEKPMDFSRKNKLPLKDLHKILMTVVFPDKFKAAEKFRLNEDDRNFVLEHMSKFPGESKFPAYDTATYPNAYAKFIFYGGEKGVLPENIRIFNKVGDAYGQLVDAAYFVDYQNKVEFFVSAAITCNTDGIMNDDRYDYETIGFPFLKKVGQLLYQHELKRKKKFLPDLSAVQFNYNK
ncbi:MAG: serine hydrolase [Ferruginibacter sp.]